MSEKSLQKLLEASFNVRYLKLHFTVAAQANCSFPITKAPALRFGIEQQLLTEICDAEYENCCHCSSSEQCIVRKTMILGSDIKPAFCSVGDRVGYIVECENNRKYFKRNDKFEFTLVLFGRMILYAKEFSDAVTRLGMKGIGKDSAKFSVESIDDGSGRQITDYAESEFPYQSLGEYVSFKNKSIAREKVDRIQFMTPTSLKYRKGDKEFFQMENILESIQRRLYILACYEHIDIEELYHLRLSPISIYYQDIQQVCTYWYTEKSKKNVRMNGLAGCIYIGSVQEAEYNLLLAGELLHIGKYTGIGFGRYKLE